MLKARCKAPCAVASKQTVRNTKVVQPGLPPLSGIQEAFLYNYKTEKQFGWYRDLRYYKGRPMEK